MKKFALMALAACAVVACHDDNNNPVEVSLYGTWKLTSIVIPQGIDLNNDGTAGTDLVTESGCMDNSKIIFTQDVSSAVINMQDLDIEQADNGSYSATCSAPGTESSPYTVAGNNITFTFEGEQVTFIKTGNTLTTAQDGSSLTFKKM